jgi:hypothetical protein
MLATAYGRLKVSFGFRYPKIVPGLRSQARDGFRIGQLMLSVRS